MRWTPKHKSIEQWHECFAYFPVTIDTGERIWLEKVWARYIEFGRQSQWIYAKTPYKVRFVDYWPDRPAPPPAPPKKEYS